VSRARLVVATGNAGKLREFRAILASPELELLALSDLGDVALPEEGAVYEANAVAKARAVLDQTGEAAVADDSGIEVDALAGAPGPFSARYGGVGLGDRGRLEHLLAEMRRSGDDRRGARFVCVAALALPDAEPVVARGVCEGEILTRPQGEGGFGYDPIFRPRGYEVSMAEIGESEKNQISHRARALHALVQTSSWLRRCLT
jgi:XTP/dITP diphosphohydrolase